MTRENEKKFLGIVTLLFLILCGWYIYRDFTIIRNPVNFPQNYDLATDSLIAQIEKTIEEDDTPLIDSMKQLERSNIHFDLARFYAYLGDTHKAEEHLGKITFNSDKIDLLQVYTLMMLNAAASNDYEFVFKTLLNSRNISEKIAKIGYLRNENDRENKVKNHEPSEEVITGILCAYSGRIFAEAGRYDDLDKLIALPSCDNKKAQIFSYKISTLILNGEYKRAYADLAMFFEPSEKLPAVLMNITDSLEYSSIERPVDMFNVAANIRTCMRGSEAQPLPSPDNVNFLTDTAKDQENKNKNTAYFAAAILQGLDKTDEAVLVSQTIQNQFLRKQSLMLSLQNYYADGLREKVLETDSLIESSDSPQKKPEMESHDKRLGNLIASNDPSSLSYELAMMIEDPGIRFDALKKIYTSKNDFGKNFPPGCEGGKYQCVFDEMTRIAKSTESAELRDRMYFTVSSMQVHEGLFDDALKSYAEIQGPASPSCSKGACEYLLSRIPACMEAFPKQIPGLSTRADLQKIANCHYVSQYYKTYIASGDLFATMNHHQQMYILGNDYLVALAQNLGRDDHFEESISIAAKIDNPVIRREVIINLWQENEHPFPRHHAVYEEVTGKRLEGRTKILKALLGTPIFLNDQDLWDRMAQYTMFQFWTHYSERITASAEEERNWSKPLWEIMDMIEREKPHTKEANCSPQSFRNFDGECGVRTLAVKGREQDAVNYAKISEKYNAARIILFERFMAQGDKFRNAMNDGFAFPYISSRANRCPLSRN